MALDPRMAALLARHPNVRVTSGYRSPKHPIEARKKEPGMHAHGLAADLDLSGLDEVERLALMNDLYGQGATRFGLYSDKNILHVDLSQDQGRFHKMYDRTVKNIHKAPEYFRTWSPDGGGGSTVPAAQIAPGPAYQGGSVQPVSAPAGTPEPGGQQQMTGSDYLHPAIKAIMERQQQSQGADWGDALLGMGMGMLNAGGGPGAGNWFGAGVRGAAQMMAAGQPEKMTELQLLKANHELQTLEEKAQERRQKRSSMERLKQRYPEYAEAIDAGLMGKDAFAEVMGLGGEGAATYGKAGVPFQIGEFENGTPKYGMMQLGDDGSYKMHALPQGYEPKWGPEQQAEITREKAKAKGLGEHEAEKIVEFPIVHSNVQRMVKTIDSLLDDPVGMRRAVGAISIFPTIPGGNAADYESRLAQLYGQNFLLAYQDLKGGGQITEIEGQKAEQALVALGTAQSVEEHRKALQEYRQAAIDGYKKLRAQAPREVVDDYPNPFEPDQTQEGAQRVRKYNPETGTVE